MQAIITCRDAGSPAPLLSSPVHIYCLHPCVRFRCACITWRCEVNGQDGPSGISINEVNADGKICFARDIPAPSIKPPPVAALAEKLRPRLRTLKARVPAPSMRAPAPDARATTPAMKAAATSPPSGLDAVISMPPRAAMALAWIAFSAYVALASPGEFSVSPDSFDNQLIAKAIDDPTSLNPIFFAVFNALGVLPGVNAALLLPGAKDQRPLPTVPFVVSSFALGFGGIGPYLALREARPDALAKSDVGFATRYVLESKLYAAGLLAASIYLVSLLFALPDSASAGFSELFASSKLVHVSTVDFFVLSAFAFEPIREDMARRGWWGDGKGGPADGQLTRLLAFSLVPLVGPCAYLLLRPGLSDE